MEEGEKEERGGECEGRPERAVTHPSHHSSACDGPSRPQLMEEGSTTLAALDVPGPLPPRSTEAAGQGPRASYRVSTSSFESSHVGRCRVGDREKHAQVIAHSKCSIYRADSCLKMKEQPPLASCVNDGGS